MLWVRDADRQVSPLCSVDVLESRLPSGDVTTPVCHVPVAVSTGCREKRLFTRAYTEPTRPRSPPISVPLPVPSRPGIDSADDAIESSRLSGDDVAPACRVFSVEFGGVVVFANCRLTRLHNAYLYSSSSSCTSTVLIASASPASFEYGKRLASSPSSRPIPPSPSPSSCARPTARACCSRARRGQGGEDE